MVRLVLILALLASAGCIVRDNPCAEDSRAPAWLAAQCQLGDVDESDTGSDATAGETSVVETCNSHFDCCDHLGPDEYCGRKCVVESDGKKVCYGSGDGSLGDACDSYRDQRIDTCNTVHVCVTHQDNDDIAKNEGYCKPLCYDDGSCGVDLPPEFTCVINGLCRAVCEPLDDKPCLGGESCRWIHDDMHSRFDCQPFEVSEKCLPQLLPDQPSDCPAGTMCVADRVGQVTTWRCAALCGPSKPCPTGDCVDFRDKIPPDQRPEDPFETELGFCSE